MIKNNHKTSLLIPSQLPEFIRDNPDYSKFVAFLQAYYEWMEENNNVTDRSKNLLNYKDIDQTTDDFLQYFTNDFLPYFPEDALADKQKTIKIARELYKSKGTPASYEFLFRVLYDSSFDFYNTKDVVFIASGSQWFVAKSLRLSTLDPNFANIKNYRLFGETSKSIATVENTVQTGNKTEVFISGIERIFESGEFVRVVDNNNQSVLFNGQPLRAKIVGQINQINIDPKNRGSLYVPGDPVIVYGGLSPDSVNPVSATAEVGTTTLGSIQRINVVTGGFGYRAVPNSSIILTGAPTAIANVATLDPDSRHIANVSLLSINEILFDQSGQGPTIGNTQYSFITTLYAANANTSLANALTFASFSTYPISSVVVENGGQNVLTPFAVAESLYDTNIPGNKGNLKSIGILAPIQIINPGTGYQINDKIVFSGGSGYGAYANVTNVTISGAITEIKYVLPPLNSYSLGGMGYTHDALPAVSVLSANNQAANASIYVPGILGDGATFSIVTDDKAGAVTTILIDNFGEDYVARPNVSLKIQDIVVTGITGANIPIKGDIVYQGNSLATSTYQATVDSISALTGSYYKLRVYNYNAIPNPNIVIHVSRNNQSFSMANTAIDSTYNKNGVRTYGDGAAKAVASFLNGLTLSQGNWIGTQGHPSSFAKLESENYNNFTYQITVEKEIAKYRNTLLNLLHPSGTKVLGRYVLKSNVSTTSTGLDVINKALTLYHYTGTAAANVTMSTDFTTKSTNIVQFNNLGTGVNIANFIFANSSIGIVPTIGSDNQEIFSEIISINPSSNTVTLKTNTWLTFANVAYAAAQSGSNVINISALTGAYDVINNGNYSNTAYPLIDIVYAGDKVLIANNTAKTVQSVDYVNGIITLTSNLTANASNALLSVSRTFYAGGTLDTAQNIKIYGPIGLQYFPEITTESGDSITTEDGTLILLG